MSPAGLGPTIRHRVQVIDYMPTDSRPRVSVITPCYNSSAFIAETIGSVQAQTFESWEMLLVDDVSTDDTAKIIEKMASQDPRLKLIRRTTNGGPAVARNAALEQAKGRYIAFLDHDDLWLPEKLVRQLTFMAEKHCAISYTAYRRIGETGARAGRVIHAPAELSYRALLKNTAICNMTSMVDQDMTGPIRVPEVPYDDYLLWLSLLKKGHRACGLDQDLGRFRVVRGSASSRKTNAVLWVWRIYRENEGLGFLESAWYLANYAARAALKRLG